MRIVLCCGDRNWNDQKKVDRVLEHEHKKHPIDFVIEGGQVTTGQVQVGPGLREHDWHEQKYGGDYQAKVAAQKLGIQVIECPANWRYFYHAAGPVRNKKQLEVAMELGCEGGMISGAEQKMNVLVIAFHSNIKKSKGTKNMLKLAEKAKIKTRLVK